MRKRGTQDSAPPSSPAWMATYGDMVTLLLVFFVLLFSFSTIDGQKWRSLVIALTGNIGVLEQGSSLEDLMSVPSDPDLEAEEPPVPSPEPSPYPESDPFEALYLRIKAFVEENDLQEQLVLLKGDFEIVIRFRDHALFDSGRADIKEDALGVLTGIAKILVAHAQDIAAVRVEGHTDNVPINTPQFPSNWELSTGRAVGVLRLFAEEKGFEPRKLSAVGYGEYHPVADNDTPENRARNRRVDILIVRPPQFTEQEGLGR